MKNVSRRRIGTPRLVALYALLAFILSFILCALLDCYLGEGLGTQSVSILRQAPVYLPTDAEQASVSCDGRYLSYRLDGEVSVYDLHSGKLLRTLSADCPIEWAQLMHDRNLLLYAYVEPDVARSRQVEVQPSSALQPEESGTGSEAAAQPVYQTVNYTADMVRIATYNIDNDTVREDKSFEVPRGSRIGTLAYSTLSNNIGVYVEDRTGQNPFYNLYNVDIMSAVILMAKGAEIEELVSFHNADRLSFSTTSGALYIGGRLSQAMAQQPVRLLGLDESDTLYLLPQKEPQTVYLLQEDTITGSLDLPPDYREILSRPGAIYVVYDDRVTDLLAFPGQSARYTAGRRFLSIRAGRVFTVDESGRLYAETLRLSESEHTEPATE